MKKVDNPIYYVELDYNNKSKYKSVSAKIYNLKEFSDSADSKHYLSINESSINPSFIYGFFEENKDYLLNIYKYNGQYFQDTVYSLDSVLEGYFELLLDYGVKKEDIDRDSIREYLSASKVKTKIKELIN